MSHLAWNLCFLLLIQIVLGGTGQGINEEAPETPDVHQKDPTSFDQRFKRNIGDGAGRNSPVIGGGVSDNSGYGRGIGHGANPSNNGVGQGATPNRNGGIGHGVNPNSGGIGHEARPNGNNGIGGGVVPAQPAIPNSGIGNGVGAEHHHKHHHHHDHRIGDGVRARRYAKSFLRECNSYYGKTICYRVYEDDRDIPDGYSCWNLIDGRKNCTSVETLRYLEQQRINPYYNQPTAPIRSVDYGHQPGYGNANYGIGQTRPARPRDADFGSRQQTGYNPYQTQLTDYNPRPRDADFGGVVNSDQARPYDTYRAKNY